jgi:hypothetical protein
MGWDMLLLVQAPGSRDWKLVGASDFRGSPTLGGRQVILSTDSRQWARGFWAPTVRVERYTATLCSLESSDVLTPADIEAIIAALNQATSFTQVTTPDRAAAALQVLAGSRVGRNQRVTIPGMGERSFALRPRADPGALMRATPIPIGIAHSAAAATMAFILAWSITFGGAWRVVPRVLAWRRRRIGVCPNCSYPIEGLPIARCPECGTALPADPR